MTDEILPPAGGYAAAPGWLQYSRGVRALPGHAIVRVRFQSPVPLDAGFTRIAAWLRDQGRPLTSLCACELRSPGQFTEDGFRTFNLRYAETLRDWGVMQGDANPVARSNVIPPVAAPQEPSFYAFCYAALAPGAAPSFVAAASRSRGPARITSASSPTAIPARPGCAARPSMSCRRWSGAWR